MYPIHTILVPTDFSASSHLAMEMACAIANQPGGPARVILLHIAPKTPAIIRDVPGFKEEHIQEDFMAYRQEIDARMSRLCEVVPLGNVESLIVEGDAASSILRVAEGKACDLIIMGTHGKSGVLKATMGSVAAEVSRKTRCPVVTVRVPSSSAMASPDDAAVCAVG